MNNKTCIQNSTTERRTKRTAKLTMLLLQILWCNHNERVMTGCLTWHWITRINCLNILGIGDRSSPRIHIQKKCITVSKIILSCLLNFCFHSADIARTIIDIKYPWTGIRLTDVEFDPYAGHSKADLFTAVVLTNSNDTHQKQNQDFRTQKLR